MSLRSRQHRIGGGKSISRRRICRSYCYYDGFATPAAHQASIVRAFKLAWEARDVRALIGLLDPDATTVADGGLARAVLRPVEGAEQVARLYIDIAGRTPGLTILERTVNGLPGLVAQRDGVIVAVYAFDIAGDQITHIWAMLNPDKLRPWMTGLAGNGRA